MKVKVCGIAEKQNLIQVIDQPIQMIGFNFYKKSKRYVGDDPYSLIELCPVNILKVGVFVNEPLDQLIEKNKKYGFDFLQLHGDESQDYVSTAAQHSKIIKAFGIDGSKTIDATVEGYSRCSYFLFDKKTPEYGGSGIKYDWDLLHTYSGMTPFLLSGGIGPSDAQMIMKIDHSMMAGVDINSKFEVAPGIKDTGKISLFLESLELN